MSAILRQIRPHVHAAVGLKETFLLKRLEDVLMQVEALTLKVSQAEKKDPRSSSIMMPIGKGSRKICLNDIVYCEAIGNYSKVFLTDGSTSVLAKTLKKLEESLNNSLFVRCHQSYLVNALHIIELNDDVCRVKTNGEFNDIPVSRRKIKNIKSKFVFL